MPAYKIENTSSRDKAIRVFGGTEIVKAKGSATLENAQELSEDQIGDFARLGVKITAPASVKPAKNQSKPIKG